MTAPNPQPPPNAKTANAARPAPKTNAQIAPKPPAPSKKPSSQASVRKNATTKARKKPLSPASARRSAVTKTKTKPLSSPASARKRSVTVKKRKKPLLFDSRLTSHPPISTKVAASTAAFFYCRISPRTHRTHRFSNPKASHTHTVPVLALAIFPAHRQLDSFNRTTSCSTTPPPTAYLLPRPTWVAPTARPSWRNGRRSRLKIC
jgi:hypothetical protein